MQTNLGKKSKNIERFRDRRETIDSFQNEFLVQCPRCNSCAIVRYIAPEQPGLFAPRRFSCKTCGASKNWSERRIERFCLEPVDGYFQYPLWLQTPCCGQILWAYNLQHLEFIEAFVRAKLRERQPDQRYGWSNQSLFSRLPRWMQFRQNREEVIKAIAKIRKSL